jgi:hypothetical protein
MMRHRSAFLMFVLACSLAVAAASRAQNLQNGAVRGTVYDSTHAAVPGVKLTLTSIATGIKRELTTDADGGYDFENVAPGEYQLTAELSGFATTTVKAIVVNIGAAVPIDVTLPVKGQSQSVEVIANAASVDTSTAGITQLINSRSVENLPFPGRDYRDLAQLSPTVQVVPGLRGGLRMGGQQSDYSGLVIDGADNFNNYFGENFGSLETKNLTVPLEAVQEFQVVTNGFAPEFGRASGGLLNVVTKSGTNQIHGEAHEYYRGGTLTANDALGNPSNIDNQNQFGGSVGFPIHRDRQFLFLSTDIQRENGPLDTVLCTDATVPGCSAFLASAGPIITAPANGTDTLPPACGGAAAVGQALMPACYGVSTVGGLEGPHNQYQNFFTLLGHYDYQFSPANHFSIRGLGTRNHTNGFTGGQGQTETPYSIGAAENFVNQGIGGVFALTTVMGRKVNEVRFSLSGETRKRHAIYNGAPQILINQSGASFGQRFYLPGNNDAGKLQGADNFSYSFGKHDMKFGGDVDTFEDRKDIFAGWSVGEYEFNTLCDFEPNPAAPWCANYSGTVPAAPNPYFYIQGIALNGANVFKANTLKNNFQTGTGLYWQDKWQLTQRITLTYGLRWDGTTNPQPQSAIVGNLVWVGQGINGSKQAAPPQGVPNDFSQWGPRVGLAWNVGSNEHPTVVRGAWGLYYAQTPLIFFPTVGAANQTTLFCPTQYFCAPESGLPYLYPSSVPYGAADLCSPPAGTTFIGCQSTSYVDPSFRNPRVSNFTVGVEHSFAHSWTVSANYAYVHSWNLRTGGFSTTNWYRNFVPEGTDQFGRTLLEGSVSQNADGTWAPFATPLDPTIFAFNELASFDHGNYHEIVAAVNKRFAQHYQFFANYTWSRNFSNASSERDTETFFGPQDPFNLNIDYGRDGLDITHAFKSGVVAELPWGFTWSTNMIAHSGIAYPAYYTVDTNADGVVNQFSFNDRPVVQIGSGTPFLMPEYPGRQPYFFNWDMRISKDFELRDHYQLRLVADFFNLTNASNLYSDPDVYGFVGPTSNAVCTPVNATAYSNLSCPALTALPTPSNTPGYRTVNELAPGATPFAFQAGVRFQF